MFYGAGQYLQENYDVVSYALKQGASICCGSRRKWGKEIMDGAKCLSPLELSRMEDTLVVVTAGGVATLFDMVKDLHSIGGL